MPKDIPSLKPKKLIHVLRHGGCEYYRTGKGDHILYVRYIEGKKRVVPIGMGAGELSPPYVLRIFRQFGFTDNEIEALLK
ncbi:MAG: type II toxin-antitoxin system HicA family toxin [Candidatus Anammoxibacter sp.]